MGREDKQYPLVKVRFPLGDDWEGIEAENMWAEVVAPGEYRLRNSPFYAYDVSAEDTVFATEVDNILSFAGVASRGGHSTYRILLPTGDSIESARFRKYWEPLEQLGCTYEVAKQRWLAVDIPRDVNIHEAYAMLERGEADRAWEFEEVHCGHPVRRD